jgi:hypothetical protein
MVAAETVPVRAVCRAIGYERVLRTLIDIFDASEEPRIAVQARPWLFDASADADVVAKLLAEPFIRRPSTLEMESEVVAPDFVPNNYGDDPWLLAWRGVAGQDSCSPPVYLSCFLLARALGNRSRNQADLIKIAFEAVYSAAQRSEIPDLAWRLLDGRLPRSYFWQLWDRCQRLRSGVVNAFVDRWLSPGTFLTLTDDQSLFYQLVDLAGESYNGRRYLRHVAKSTAESGRQDRLKLIEEKSNW